MNSSVKRKLIKYFNIFFWRQHPEAALRYLPVVSEIKRRKLQDSKILEIGSGSLGIIPYLKKNVDGLDIDFAGPQTKMLKKIRGRADSIPFRKNSYDVAISVDVLEHLDPQVREKAIFGMLKVAKKLAVIVVPEGEDALTPFISTSIVSSFLESGILLATTLFKNIKFNRKSGF